MDIRNVQEGTALFPALRESVAVTQMGISGAFPVRQSKCCICYDEGVWRSTYNLYDWKLFSNIP